MHIAVRRSILLPAFALGALLLALSGCAASNAGDGKADAPITVTAPALDAPAIDAPGEVDFSCRSDADCTVKNVGNCCGYYPACVNVDSPTFPEQVLAECARTGMTSVCGFADIAGCQCVEGRCAAIGVGAGPLR